METAELIAREEKTPGTVRLPPANSAPEFVDPDLAFIRKLSARGETFKKCFQCGTCSATCPLSPDSEPFPRKEMAWAAWGLRDRLLKDPDIWLCHQCNDCSLQCPRSGRPGDLLAAIRRESIKEYAFPRFLARWAGEPMYAPLLLAVPAIILGLAILVREPLENALGFEPVAGDRIVFSYSTYLPQWLLNGIFLTLGILVLMALAAGGIRFWRGIRRPGAHHGRGLGSSNGILNSAWLALRKIFTHQNFSLCTANHWRLSAHFCMFFGFIGLSLVTIWVITGKVNPLLTEFIYPFSFWSPWKVLANLAGAAVFTGSVITIGDRLVNRENAGVAGYFDWFFIWGIFLVVSTGFAAELLHYLRMVPHRHVIYFIHLVFAFALLMYLPFSKFAHLLYRTIALVQAESLGRTVSSRSRASQTKNVPERNPEKDPRDLVLGQVS